MRYAALLTSFVFVFCVGVPQAHATAYYADFVNGNDNNAGTSTTSPFQSINQFANNTRAAGDILFVRRGQASTTNVAAVTFTTDGTLNSPITVTADYDGLWPQDFGTSMTTWSPTFGSTFVASAASSTDFATSNKWVWFGTDCTMRYNSAVTAPTGNVGANPCEFAYEVASTSQNGIQLYLPYKGPSAGSGVSMTVASSAPQIGTATEANQIFTMSSDDFWLFKGLDIRSTASGCVSTAANNRSLTFLDFIFQGDGTSDCSFGITASGVEGTEIQGHLFKKIRTFGNLATNPSTNTGEVVKDFLIDCNNVASSFGFRLNAGPSYLHILSDGVVQNCTNSYSIGNYGGRVQERNIKKNRSEGAFTGTGAVFYTEDSFGLISLNSLYTGAVAANGATTTQATTTNLRSGGGPKNLVVFPPSGTGNTGLSVLNNPFSQIKLFEYPIYSDAASHTYTVWFNSTSTAQFSVSPFTSTQTGSSTPELYIECEYYNDASDADRYLKRSNTANDVDFTTSTAWQDISITCAPTQAGILFLRGFYGKPKESGANDYNAFYMDTTPVIE